MIVHILTSITCLLLVLIAIEDFRSMQIRLLWFLLLLPAIIFMSLQRVNIFEWATVVTINAIIFLIIFFISGVLLLIRNKWSLSKLKSSLGFGDFLIFFALALCMSNMLFVVCLQLALIFSLVYYFLRQMVLRQNNNRVPLAGVCAIVLCLMLMANIFFELPPLYNDNWLLNKMGLI